MADEAAQEDPRPTLAVGVYVASSGEAVRQVPPSTARHIYPTSLLLQKLFRPPGSLTREVFGEGAVLLNRPVVKLGKWKSSDFWDCSRHAWNFISAPHKTGDTAVRGKVDGGDA